MSDPRRVNPVEALPGLATPGPRLPAPPLPPIEALPAPAAPDPACPRCRGDGVATEARGERAVASVCACIPPCARCRGTGQVHALVNGVPRSGRCRCQQIPDRVLLFNGAHIPGHYAAASVSGFMMGALKAGDHAKQAALAGVSPWLAGQAARGLILHGAVGRGKTHLLVGLLRDLVLKRGQRVRFIEFTRLLSALKAGYTEGRSDAAVFDDLVAVPILGIDELGKGRLTDWELTVIDELIGRRYNANALTFGTTNFRPGPPSGAAAPNAALLDAPTQTLGDRVGERVWSRLVEMCDFVEVGGADARAWARA